MAATSIETLARSYGSTEERTPLLLQGCIKLEGGGNICINPSKYEWECRWGKERNYVRQRHSGNKGMELWRCLVGLGDATYLEPHCLTEQPSATRGY